MSHSYQCPEEPTIPYLLASDISAPVKLHRVLTVQESMRGYGRAFMSTSDSFALRVATFGDYLFRSESLGLLRIVSFNGDRQCEYGCRRNC